MRAFLAMLDAGEMLVRTLDLEGQVDAEVLAALRRHAILRPLPSREARAVGVGRAARRRVLGRGRTRAAGAVDVPRRVRDDRLSGLRHE
jgi:hypothetical protein